ncbi:uncharacterized protein [Diabrotica undecimpunctata]|uniref:uncharacterized protein n=1 Tax=Diabrotica undecimpunctata TaxID=50387 RepID=UPI003B63FAD2
MWKKNKPLGEAELYALLLSDSEEDGLAELDESNSEASDNDGCEPEAHEGNLSITELENEEVLATTSENIDSKRSNVSDVLCEGRTWRYLAPKKGIYDVNDDANLAEKDQFYDLLNETLIKVGNQREIILLGDFNSRVGKREKDPVIGRYGEEAENDNGRRLIELCQQHQLRIWNGYFKHRDIHKYTWHQDTRNIKSIIDYVITKQNTKLNIQDTRAYRGKECGSDHYNVRSLQEYSTKILYQNRLNEKLLEEYLTAETNQLYEHITDCIHHAAQEALGEETRTVHRSAGKITWNTQLKEQRNKKQEAYKRWLNTKNLEDKEIYKVQQRISKDMTRNNKNETWDAKCKEVDCYIGGARSSATWKLVKT